MKTAALASLLLATAVLAGTRFRDSDGSPPTSCVDLKARGVSLTSMSTANCRMSVHVDGGGNIQSGRLVPFYCDDVLTEPVELPSAQHCTIAARLDAGLRTGYACDILPGTQIGWIMTTGYNVAGLDAGSGAAVLPDAGTGPQPVFRTECGHTP